MKKRLVAFVCTGNTCRSPMAERLLAHALAAEPTLAEQFEAISCGVAAANGQPASANSVRALKSVGIGLDAHRSRQLTPSILSEAEVLIAMTDSHLRAIHQRYGALPRETYLMREFSPGLDSGDIPDPFGGGILDYEECRDVMIESMPGLLRYLRARVAKKPSE